MIEIVTTVVFLHAHPDDEASQTSGTMARLVQEGHRVVAVFATNGEHGTVPDDLAPGESVIDRRKAEALAAAAIIGIARVEFLGYQDSGMTGWEQNAHPECFVQADVDEAAGRLVAILDDESAEVVVGYDWHGNYGHPDHIAVHNVVHRAAELAARRPRVLEQTTNQDDAQRMAARAVAAGLALEEMEMVGDDGLPMGLPESDLHWRVDVTDYLELKRAALAAHGSQSDTQWMLSVPEQGFRDWLGFEHYREPGRSGPMVTAWPFADSQTTDSLGRAC